MTKAAVDESSRVPAGTLSEAMQAWANLAEVERIEQDRDLRLAVGTVVRRADGQHGTAVRGIVVSHGPNPARMPGDFVVRVAAGVHRVSNDVAAWERVPVEEQTHEERVRAADIAYDPGMDGESMAWGLIGALLPPSTWDRMCDGLHDWPTELDLALEVAARLDRLEGDDEVVTDENVR